jgi:hypothetical protein
MQHLARRYLFTVEQEERVAALLLLYFALDQELLLLAPFAVLSRQALGLGLPVLILLLLLVAALLLLLLVAALFFLLHVASPLLGLLCFSLLFLIFSFLFFVDRMSGLRGISVGDSADGPRGDIFCG